MLIKEPTGCVKTESKSDLNASEVQACDALGGNGSFFHISIICSHL
jgi:hypothetical protein